MMTLKDCITVGKCVVDAMKRECAQNVDKSALSNKRIYGSRGTALYAIDSIWYDIVPLKEKDKGLTRDKFYSLIEWK